MSEPIILAIDLGTSGPKVALLSTRGVVLGGTSEPVPLHILPQGGVEQDPADWWRGICSASRRLLAHNPLAQQVRGVCVTAQWAGTVPIDAEGNPLMRAIIWMDDRGAPYVQRRIGGFPSVQGYGAAKLWTWLRRTGGIPSPSGKDPVAHILFIQHERPDIYQRTFKFLEPKDYVNSRLTGRCMATIESITMHWVTDNRDIHNVHYDAQLLAMRPRPRQAPGPVPGRRQPRSADTCRGRGPGASYAGGSDCGDTRHPLRCNWLGRNRRFCRPLLYRHIVVAGLPCAL